MTCDRCEELEEEVAYLRRQLRVSDDQAQLARFRQGLNVPPGQARVAQMLYLARGNLVTFESFYSALYIHPGDEPQEPNRIVIVYVSRLRPHLPPGAIQSVPRAGYILTTAGIAALEPFA